MTLDARTLVARLLQCPEVRRAVGWRGRVPCVVHLPPALGATRSLHMLGPRPSESLLTRITLEVSVSDVRFSDELPVRPFPSPLWGWRWCLCPWDTWASGSDLPGAATYEIHV